MAHLQLDTEEKIDIELVSHTKEEVLRVLPQLGLEYTPTGDKIFQFNTKPPSSRSEYEANTIYWMRVLYLMWAANVTIEFGVVNLSLRSVNRFSWEESRNLETVFQQSNWMYFSNKPFCKGWSVATEATGPDPVVASKIQVLQLRFDPDSGEFLDHEDSFMEFGYTTVPMMGKKMIEVDPGDIISLKVRF